MKMGPTSANCCPTRILFVCNQEGKERLKPAIVEANHAKTMTAPVVAIIGYDLGYSAHFDRMYPQIPEPLKKRHQEDAAYVTETAFRNGTLQGGYFIVAARAIGLDCGAISGFNNAMVDELFFAGTQTKSNFICNIGYGDASKVLPKFDRFGFDDVCEII